MIGKKNILPRSGGCLGGTRLFLLEVYWIPSDLATKVLRPGQGVAEDSIQARV